MTLCSVSFCPDVKKTTGQPISSGKCYPPRLNVLHAEAPGVPPNEKPGTSAGRIVNKNFGIELRTFKHPRILAPKRKLLARNNKTEWDAPVVITLLGELQGLSA